MNASRAVFRPKKEKVSDYLIYEVIDGKPYYRKGYKEVMNHTKTLEEIMGSRSLQFILIDYLLGMIYNFIDRSKYYVATNEARLHFKRKTNLANDIAIYSKDVVTPDKISKRYADVPPRVVIEVDTKVEITDNDWIVHTNNSQTARFWSRARHLDFYGNAPGDGCRTSAGLAY